VSEHNGGRPLVELARYASGIMSALPFWPTASRQEVPCGRPEGFGTWSEHNGGRPLVELARYASGIMSALPFWPTASRQEVPCGRPEGFGT
jgi:hypothetical protein